MPNVMEARLGPEELEVLLADLGTSAENLRATVRGSTRGSVPRGVGLDGVREEIRSGRGVQLRYDHGGVRWIDTLTPHGASVRLVRVREWTPESPSVEDERDPTGKRRGNERR